MATKTNKIDQVLDVTGVETPHFFDDGSLLLTVDTNQIGNVMLVIDSATAAYLTRQLIDRALKMLEAR